MKGKRKILIALLLGVLLGWTLGFLRLPDIETKASFWIGVMASLTVLLLVYFFYWLWNKNERLARWIENTTKVESSKEASWTHRLVWISVAFFIVFGGLLIERLIDRQYAFYKTEVAEQKEQLMQQAELLESSRRSNTRILMTEMTDQIDGALDKHPERKLSEEMIKRIVGLSYSFKPYHYLEGDSLSRDRLSLERGQLLLLLVRINMDSSSLAQIKNQVSFEGADLRAADLSYADLSGVKLKGANLKDANLKEANLKDADLRSTQLWGANLNFASLYRADLRRAELAWGTLNSADLRKANLNGVDLRNTKLEKANLVGANLQWANLRGARFVEADLTHADFYGSYLNQVDLKHADLRDANLRRLDLTEVNLTGVQLARASVEEDNWLEKLNEWRVMGRQAIQESYRMVDDTTGRTNYQLDKIK